MKSTSTLNILEMSRGRKDAHLDLPSKVPDWSSAFLGPASFIERGDKASWNFSPHKGHVL